MKYIIISIRRIFVCFLVYHIILTVNIEYKPDTES